MGIADELMMKGFIGFDVGNGWELFRHHGKLSDYVIANISNGGIAQFFVIRPDDKGNPIIIAEPDLAVGPPRDLSYVDGKGKPVTPDQYIAGLVCFNEDGKTVKRLSISNAVQSNVKIVFRERGVIEVGGTVYWLWILFEKDKNRIRNYDALLYPFSPNGPVKILELEDLGVLFLK